MYPYRGVPLDGMSCRPIQPDVITTPKSEGGSWVYIDGESTSPGHKGVLPASTKNSTSVNVTGVGTDESSCHTSLDGRYQDASPTGPREKPGRPPFECSLCPERKLFTQSQVLLRHQREKHQPGFKCWHPDCDHVWTRSRKCEYRKHLRKKHGREDDEIEEILAYPPVIKSDGLSPHFSPPPADVHHASPPLIHTAAYDLRLGDREPEITITKPEDCGLEHFTATLAPSKLLSEEDSALVKEHFKIHRRFRFPSGHSGADIPPNPGMPHIPSLPTQQPGTQWPWFSPPPQAPYPALSSPTQQMPPDSPEEMWYDTHYPAVLDHRQLCEPLARTNPEVFIPLKGQSPLSQVVILTLVHRLAWAISESAPVDELLWWLQRSATVLNINDQLIAPYTACIVPSVQLMLDTTKQRVNYPS